MPANGELYVLAPGEGEAESDGWVSPRPITEAVGAAVADATDLAADDVDDADAYVDIDRVETLLDGEDDDDSLTFTVEGHDVTIDGGGHVSVDPSE
ncbi:HalOD1 output domain-containing protein [Halosimplex aquaticum]|uniref:HalOD1 output domain-containing protein n=1 Tax=Halosimplex aquaticum TaxID=3026162 RepID=A0ABD5Y6U4_9EURY|nr:HalOD1 output domain-containing protein [Halosimplex aquaticum]